MEIGKLLEAKRDDIFTIHEHSRMLGRGRFCSRHGGSREVAKQILSQATPI
jgi:hypothetical protein